MMKRFQFPTIGILVGAVIGFCGVFSVQSQRFEALAEPIPDKSATLTTPGELLLAASGKSATAPETAVVPADAISSLKQKMKCMMEGEKFLHEKNTYTATIHKREFVSGELQDEHVILMKCRQKPFSVYLKWETADPGREVIFVEGSRQGKMIGHDGGWKIKFPALVLPVDCKLALRDARYPVTESGIGGLNKIMLKIHQEDVQKNSVRTCDIKSGQPFNERTCDVYTVVYKSAWDSPTYRKAITYIDSEWKVPIQSHHFEWPKTTETCSEEEIDGSTLIESYTFTDVQFGIPLTDRDFDPKNPEYDFR